MQVTGYSTWNTNRHASSYLSLDELSSFFVSWPKDGITIYDIKAFFALTVAMGVVVQQDLADLLEYQHPTPYSVFRASDATRYYFEHIELFKSLRQ